MKIKLKFLVDHIEFKIVGELFADKKLAVDNIDKLGIVNNYIATAKHPPLITALQVYDEDDRDKESVSGESPI